MREHTYNENDPIIIPRPENLSEKECIVLELGAICNHFVPVGSDQFYKSLNDAIALIERQGNLITKYRKKAKRFKRKFLELKEEMKNGQE